MGRHAARRAANAANRSIETGWLRSTMTGLTSGGANPGAVETPTVPILTCAQCGRKVYTLVEGNCFYCGRPVEGKNLAEMSASQANATHACGIKNRSHVDGWDGNWLDCAEAARRMGR